jgi:hypothetical protein
MSEVVNGVLQANAPGETTVRVVDRVFDAASRARRR